MLAVAYDIGVFSANFMFTIRSNFNILILQHFMQPDATCAIFGRNRTTTYAHAHMSGHILCILFNNCIIIGTATSGIGSHGIEMICEKEPIALYTSTLFLCKRSENGPAFIKCRLYIL